MSQLNSSRSLHRDQLLSATQSQSEQSNLTPLILFENAQDLELDENYVAALKNFAQSRTEKYNAPRVIIKHFLNSALGELRKYCSTSSDDALQDFWNEYSLITRNNFINVNELAASDIDCDVSLLIRTASVAGTLDELESKILESVPKSASHFIRDPKSDKWADKRKLDSLMMSGTGLTSSQRRTLAEIAMICKHSNRYSRACDLYLFLNQNEAIVGSAHKFLSPLSRARIAGSFGSTNGLALSLIDYIDCHSSARRDELEQYSERDENSTQFLAYLKLGLIDEALQVFAIDCLSKEEQIICQAIENLQNVIKTSNCSRLMDSIDPELSGSTMTRVQRSLLDDQSLVTQVITVIILDLNIFLLKLYPSNKNIDISSADNATSLAKLEVMIRKLVELYLELLNFDASDALVRATNGLVGAVKERLDALADSDAIGRDFRKLVELIAGKCMIEGRYKSAAVLYSQIEDNVSAVKSLMRTGDVDIVLNFSLLVHDMIVNRLTINYLKHLNVEQEVIEDFISKSHL